MRKLATVSLALSAAILLSVYVIPGEWLWLGAAICGAGAVVFACVRLRIRLRMLLILVPMAFGFLWSIGYGALVLDPLNEMVGDSVPVRAVVLDYSTEYGNGNSVELRVTDPAGNRAKVRTVSYIGGLEELRPGDTISATLKIQRPQRDESTIALADGAVLRGRFLELPTVAGRSDWAWSYFPKEIVHAMKLSVERSMPADMMGLMKALLTGDRMDLYDNHELLAGMQKSGIMHIVAISGMHVAFLVGLVRQLTGRRRLTAFICIPLILIFIPMVGAAPSVIRAGFMQICLLLAPIFRRENDGITSLSTVLMLLLLASPGAGAGASLQLSFGAMAGILLVTPRVYTWLMEMAEDTWLLGGRFRRGVTRFLAAGLSSTLGAMVFTVPLMALHFGYVPIYSALTNLLTLAVMSACFVLGYGMCILGMLVPVLGIFAGWILAWPLRYVAAVSVWIGGWPWAALYTGNNMAAWWLVFVYVLLIATYLCKGKLSYRPIVPMGAAICMLCLVLFLTGENARRENAVAVLDVGQGQSVAICSGSHTALIDCGGWNDGESAGNLAAAYLQSTGRYELDLLILTHFHQDHAEGVPYLLANMDVERMIVPRDVELGDELAQEILESAQRHGVIVTYLEEDTLATLGEVQFRIFAPIGGETENERGLIVLASMDEFDLLVTGDANSTIERRLLYRERLPDIEVLVAGHHGSALSTSEELLAYTHPEAAVISVGDNSYGHPAAETLERLNAAGIEIYRTDQSGMVTIRIGETGE